MGPIWGWQDPGGSHIGPMNFAIWVGTIEHVHIRVEFLQNIICWCDWYNPLQVWNPFIVPWIDVESYSNMLCLEWELLQWLKPIGISHCAWIDMMSSWHENFFCVTVSILLLICEGYPEVTGGFFSQRSSVFFDVGLYYVSKPIEEPVIYDTMTLIRDPCVEIGMRLILLSPLWY